jgi:hypothetical protein
MTIVAEDELISDHDQATTDRDDVEGLLTKMTPQADEYLVAALNHLSESFDPDKVEGLAQRNQ